MNAHNTFDEPNRINPAKFFGAVIDEGTLEISIPSKSVLVVELK